MGDLTIIYYTSNQEAECFESAIRKTLANHADGVPIISVSQKPINFGKNICVGDIGVSERNILRQIQKGLEEAKTDFVALAEADCLFPPEYFLCRPERDDVYCYPGNGYVIWYGHRTFWKKWFRELVGIVGRNHLTKIVDLLVKNPWKDISTAIMPLTDRETIMTDAPIVTIKTKRGMHRASPRSRSRHLTELPLWGTAEALWRAYPCG